MLSIDGDKKRQALIMKLSGFYRIPLGLVFLINTPDATVEVLNFPHE